MQDADPDELLLDGQQRITSLYQATYSKEPVRTRSPRGTEVQRYYYLDISKSLDSSENIEDAIIGVPTSKQIKVDFGRRVELDLSTPEREFERDMFPLNRGIRQQGLVL